MLVSKVYPRHAGKAAMHRACENSLRRLQTDYLDMYLLHWRGDIPLQETVEAMEKLVAEGKIRRWGVSNLDTEDMQALWRTADGEHCATNRCSTISHRGALNTISCPGASSTVCR